MQEVGSYLSSGQGPMNEEHGGRKGKVECTLCSAECECPAYSINFVD